MNKLIAWSRRYSLTILRWSMAIVFLWFGILKLLPVKGEAEDMGLRTLLWLTGNAINARPLMLLLAFTEIIIGAGLLLKKGMAIILLLLFLQMAGTLLPLIIFPGETWLGWFRPSLSGHYIIKNIVLIAAGIVITGTTGKTNETVTGKAAVIRKPGEASTVS